MEVAARCARAGNRILSFSVMVLILVMLLYGGYSLWDTAMLYRGAFASSDLLKFKPSTGAEEAENPTLSDLQAINAEVRGWITVDDTHIDYPVVQGEDDMKYVNMDVYGNFSLSGSVFLDNQNSPDFLDQYNLLYGHHMDNGGMFGDIVKFRDSGFFEKHQTGTLFSPEHTWTITFFACIETDAFDSVIFNPDTVNSGSQKVLLDHIRQKAVQYRDIGIMAEDSVVALSTCAEAETNGRVILFGRLNRESHALQGGAVKS